MTTPARRIAAEVLSRVATGGAFANLALDAELRAAGVLEPRESALATEISYGVLRWQLQLDRAIAAHSDRPLNELDVEVQAALRIGAFELLHHATVPARAIVNEAVELCKERGAGRASGFVNAVLRRIAADRAPPAPPPVEADPAGHIAAVSAHPRWLVEKWIAWLGFDETLQLCLANQQIAPATVRARRGLRAQALEKLPGAIPGKYAPDALILPPGTPPALDLDGHAEGFFQAQDEGAQLVSLFCAPTPDARVLDACAAPGGKACQLAELAGSVLAIDLHARKVKQIEEAARRLDLTNLCAMPADAGLPIPGEAFASFDLVLLDAPCSGLGTLRRHPEVKLRRTPADIDKLAALQSRLLASVQRYVKPGGLLVFALCTLTREECDEQAERFLRAFPQFREDPPPADFPAACLDGNRLRTLPHRTGTDGFFAVRFRRMESP